QRTVPVSPGAGAVAVVVAIRRQQQTGARAELDQVDARRACGEERRQERPGPPDLVGLHALLANEPGEERCLPLERAGDVVPRRLPREHEVVQAAEQTERDVPRDRLRQDRVEPTLADELTEQRRVQGRPAVAERGLPLEGLGPAGYFAAASAVFACSTI